MEQYQLKKPEYIKRRKRKGCGHSSGQGKTAGRGMNGQRSRSGSTKRPWFEGGQMPIQRRVPKRGFNNYTRKNYQIVNVSSLDKLDVSEVTPEVLKKKGIIKNQSGLIKICGNGEISKSITVTADAFTASAAEKIKKSGGETKIREKIITRVDNG